MYQVIENFEKQIEIFNFENKLIEHIDISNEKEILINFQFIDCNTYWCFFSAYSLTHNMNYDNLTFTKEAIINLITNGFIKAHDWSFRIIDFEKG